MVVRTAATTSYTPDRTTINAATEPGSPTYASTINWIDADANVWQVTENDNYGADRNTRYRYDQAGQLISIVDADANTTNLSYNLLGWRVFLNDPNAGYADTRFYETWG